tara:strand:+ start:201 stop:329 length:129 start_codon:yes stop_codon:yes gene_type:complete
MKLNQKSSTREYTTKEDQWALEKSKVRMVAVQARDHITAPFK